MPRGTVSRLSQVNCFRRCKSGTKSCPFPASQAKKVLNFPIAFILLRILEGSWTFVPPAHLLGCMLFKQGDGYESKTGVGLWKCFWKSLKYQMPCVFIQFGCVHTYHSVGVYPTSWVSLGQREREVFDQHEPQWIDSDGLSS